MNVGSPSIHVNLQVASSAAAIPGAARVLQWADAALAGRTDAAGVSVPELTVRFVDEAEGRALNLQYRGIDRATNVLSFPFEAPPGIAEAEALLGDVVVCVPIVVREAEAQHKSAEEHYAHMIVHGMLHLLGFDHLQDEQAAEMEAMESEILADLGYSNPYRVVDVD